jgi:hypothetical protein
VIADDKTRRLFFDGPGRREAARGFNDKDAYPKGY